VVFTGSLLLRNNGYGDAFMLVGPLRSAAPGSFEGCAFRTLYAYQDAQCQAEKDKSGKRLHFVWTVHFYSFL